MKTNTNTQFRQDNTRGYSAADLVVLNAEFERALIGFDGDEDQIAALAERVQREFDREHLCVS